MENQQFQTGDVVYLKSDIKKEIPMTIIKPWNSLGEFQVIWLTKNGDQKYDVFHANTLKNAT